MIVYAVPNQPAESPSFANAMSQMKNRRTHITSNIRKRNEIMTYKKRVSAILLASALTVGALAGCGNTSDSSSASGSGESGSSAELTNVSYDPTRELYEAYNEAFAAYWKEQTGQDVTVTQSHGG